MSSHRVEIWWLTRAIKADKSLLEAKTPRGNKLKVPYRFLRWLRISTFHLTKSYLKTTLDDTVCYGLSCRINGAGVSSCMIPLLNCAWGSQACIFYTIRLENENHTTIRGLRIGFIPLINTFPIVDGVDRKGMNTDVAIGFPTILWLKVGPREKEYKKYWVFT